MLVNSRTIRTSVNVRLACEILGNNIVTTQWRISTKTKNEKSSGSRDTNF